MPTHSPNPNAFARVVVRAIALVLLAVGVAPSTVHATEILMGTGIQGSFSHFSGRAICRIISRHAEGLDCKLLPAADDIHNLTNLQGGSLDIALVDSRMLVDAINRKGQFEFLDIRYDNLGGLTPVYRQTILLVARADAGIDTLDQLKGKRINAGAPRSPRERVTDLILTAKGWTYKDFKRVDALPSSLSQDTMAFCHGTTQAMVHIGVHPDSSLQQLAALCDAKPIDMDDPDIAKLVEGHPAYSPVRIEETVYPQFDRPVATFGTTVWLVASGSLDNQTVQDIMTVMDAHREVLQHVHPAMGAFSVDPAASTGIALSPHPGATGFRSRTD